MAFATPPTTGTTTTPDDDASSSSPSFTSSPSSLPLLSTTVTAEQDDNEEQSSLFCCPLTLEVMKEPWRDTVTGQCYEKSAIQRWIFFGPGTCPLTRRRLDPAQFEPDRYLQTQILLWKQEQRQVQGEEAEDDQDSSDDDEELLFPIQEDEEETDAAKASSAVSIARWNELLSLRNGVLKNRERVHMRSLSDGDVLLVAAAAPVVDFMELYQ